MKILYTIPNFDTAGSGKALLKIAERLDKSRFEPHICCMHDRGAFFEVVRQSGIPVHIYPYTAPMSKRIQGLRQVWRISRFFKSLQPDLIHSFHYAPDYSEPLAARLAGIKWIYTKKNMNWGGSSKNGWRLRSWLASGIIAQNTDMLRDFFPGWRKVALIPRGVDTQEFAPLPGSRQEIRKRLHLPEQDRLIVCVANLVPVKGVEVLIRAFEQVAQTLPDTRLVIVGDDRGDYAVKLKQEVGEKNLSNHIRFTGKVLNVADYLHAADLFVLPTLNQGRQEGSPVSLLEAMACGLPVLASDVAGVRDQLSNFPELLFPPGQVPELAERLKIIVCQSIEENQILADKLRLEVINRFSIEEEVVNHQLFYSRVKKTEAK